MNKSTLFFIGFFLLTVVVFGGKAERNNFFKTYPGFKKETIFVSFLKDGVKVKNLKIKNLNKFDAKKNEKLFKALGFSFLKDLYVKDLEIKNGKIFNVSFDVKNIKKEEKRFFLSDFYENFSDFEFFKKFTLENLISLSTNIYSLRIINSNVVDMKLIGLGFESTSVLEKVFKNIYFSAVYLHDIRVKALKIESFTAGVGKLKNLKNTIGKIEKNEKFFKTLNKIPAVTSYDNVIYRRGVGFTYQIKLIKKKELIKFKDLASNFKNFKSDYEWFSFEVNSEGVSKLYSSHL